MGQIQSTIMCNGTTAVRICKKDDEEVYVYVYMSVVSLSECSRAVSDSSV